MNKEELYQSIKLKGRVIEQAKVGDDALGPLKNLPGKWANVPNLEGRGWNMIAVPFAGGEFGYRLLMNQYNETLTFGTVDKGVPNRGIPTDADGEDGDQFVAVLDYVQSINQIAVDDFPKSDLGGAIGAAIHHEPGLWLHMINKNTNNINIARLSTVPHGDSVMGLGTSSEILGASEIPNVSGLPIGVKPDLSSPYLSPYKHFHDNPFKGVFDPTEPNALLDKANQGVEIVKTTRLDVDTTTEGAGISNIPFITKQANASAMTSTFWIQELAEKDINGDPKMRLQYTQTVFLDFFPRKDGVPGAIRWPHISINTLEKVVEE